ncbi:uncharacterized protein LOC108705632 isoform X4 [Xenopus laevis]|uniref:Uncharacterized protein LOC108705632 isoform X4 n=1 Tax=Xenopus laevis TaxID=8355 RepID=A0A8J1KZD1_XENLA|nr:uncharacterized protein LOC108705632 isoform X4 [Xenopus laevis]
MYRPRKRGRNLRSSHYPYYRRYTYDSSDYFSKDDELFDMKRAKGPMQANPRYGHKCDANAEENISSEEAENTSVETEKLDSPEYSEECKSEERSENKDSALLVIQTNKELYQFLEYFEVASDSDVSFILKVAKGFRCALQKFKSGNLENEVCQEVVPSSERSFSGDSEASTAMKTPMESESMSLEDLVPTCSDEEDT